VKIACRDVGGGLKLKQEFGNLAQKEIFYEKVKTCKKLDLSFRNLVVEFFHSPTIYWG